MFSGIVEAHAKAIKATFRDQVVELHLKRPHEFDDLSVGDSIAVNGVCLTIESFNEDLIVFALGEETLSVTGWDLEFLSQNSFNLERSLRYGDRIHGQFVTGHVDGPGVVQRLEDHGENRILVVQFPKKLKPFIWPKGSIVIDGVSLTINSVKDYELSVCLIPETLKRTHFLETKIGDLVNLEGDYFAKGLYHQNSNRQMEKNL